MANTFPPDSLTSIEETPTKISPIEETPVKISESETKQETLTEIPVKISESETKQETLTEIPVKISESETKQETLTEILVMPDSETSRESVEENLTAKMPIGTSEAKMPIEREENEEREIEILAASPSMPAKDMGSAPWKEVVNNDLKSIHISIDALGKRTEKMEQNSVQISNDRLEKVEQDLKLHHEVILKVIENLEDVKQSTLSKKITSSVTVLLSALTVLIGYNIALFILGKKCMPYLSGLLILNLLGICSFGWVALATILESIASDKSGVDGTNETGGDATGENENDENGGDGNDLTASLLTKGRNASTRKYSWISIIVVCLYAMAHTLAGFFLMVYCQ